MISVPTSISQKISVATILQGKCKDCGYETPSFIESTGAIIGDEGAKGADCGTHEASPRIFVLHHPNERGIEAAAGITSRAACRSGRYIFICQRCCGSCGCFYESRILGLPRFALGYWPPMGIAVATGIWVMEATRSVSLAMIAFLIAPFVTISVIDFIAKKVVLWKKTRVADAFCTSENCPECDSNQPEVSGVVPCPGCRKKTMKIEMVAIS